MEEIIEDLTEEVTEDLPVVHIVIYMDVKEIAWKIMRKRL
jgi:hypothetical protein